jgi:tRNA 2-thiouridine synthesizing protein E
MPTLSTNDGSVQTDECGFLLNGSQWTPAIADAIAKGLGIAELTDKHWKVIAQCREDAARCGMSLDGARISKLSGLDRVELMRLFHGEPEQMISRISGLPRPHGAGTANDTTEETEP